MRVFWDRSLFRRKFRVVVGVSSDGGCKEYWCLWLYVGICVIEVVVV